jgi:crotonobetainyl-CoA:carnitine CoA-transferase CaiB-like acyl-CoA transferase
MNAGKLGLTLNVSIPEGRQLALRLVEWADVVMESFSPRAMKNWGLDYESLRAVKPDIIMASSCLNGHTGPHAKLAGFGTMGAQLAGFGQLAGWPDRPPAGPFGAYTDYIAPKFLAAAVLAAVEHRKRTGQGQYIDLSQAEASLHFLGPAFLDYTVNGQVMTRNGNASNECAPHAVFPCRGDDRWVAIAATTQQQWERLAIAIGQGTWISDPRFATMSDRIAHREELEMRITAWTMEHEVGEVEEALQEVGVPCHRSSRSYDAFADPQLAHRGHFVTLEHPELGPVPIESSRMRFSGTPASITRLGPTMGQDNEFVLRSILGLSDGEIEEFVAAGALE